MLPKAPIAVYADPDIPLAKARQLAQTVDLPLIQHLEPDGIYLHQTSAWLELLAYGEKGGKPLRLKVDFTEGKNLYRARKAHSELVVRAVKVRKRLPARVVDATGGLGKDAFLLAAAGCTVDVFERNPIMAVLLLDGLRRASYDHATADICARIILHPVDMVSHINETTDAPEVIYLDPMFPARTKRAKVKLDLSLLQCIAQGQEGEQELFAAAWNAGPRKIVVKRPVHGSWLCNVQPSATLQGKAVRFDMYIPSTYACLPTFFDH